MKQRRAEPVAVGRNSGLRRRTLLGRQPPNGSPTGGSSDLATILPRRREPWRIGGQGRVNAPPCPVTPGGVPTVRVGNTDLNVWSDQVTLLTVKALRRKNTVSIAWAGMANHRLPGSGTGRSNAKKGHDYHHPPGNTDDASWGRRCHPAHPPPPSVRRHLDASHRGWTARPCEKFPD
jgi:hypothetical protein